MHWLIALDPHGSVCRALAIRSVRIRSRAVNLIAFSFYTNPTVHLTSSRIWEWGWGLACVRNLTWLSELSPISSKGNIRVHTIPIYPTVCLHWAESDNEGGARLWWNPNRGADTAISEMGYGRRKDATRLITNHFGIRVARNGRRLLDDSPLTLRSIN